MKIICQQSVLNKALATVYKAITNRTTIPILKGISDVLKMYNHLLLFPIINYRPKNIYSEVNQSFLSLRRKV